MPDIQLRYSCAEICYSSESIGPAVCGRMYHFSVIFLVCVCDYSIGLTTFLFVTALNNAYRFVQEGSSNQNRSALRWKPAIIGVDGRWNNRNTYCPCFSATAGRFCGSRKGLGGGPMGWWPRELLLIFGDGT